MVMRADGIIVTDDESKKDFFSSSEEENDIENAVHNEALVVRRVLNH